jgi:hypothetical protein
MLRLAAVEQNLAGHVNLVGRAALLFLSGSQNRSACIAYADAACKIVCALEVRARVPRVGTSHFAGTTVFEQQDGSELVHL